MSKKAYEAHVRRLCNEFRTAYFLGEYSMDINFEYKDCDPEKHSLLCDDGSRVVLADISSDPTYLNFSVTFYNEMYERYKRGHKYFMANMVAHELAHCITEPLFRLAKENMSPSTEKNILQTNERQTQRVANVLMRYFPKSIWEIKKTKRKAKKKAKKK